MGVEALLQSPVTMADKLQPPVESAGVSSGEVHGTGCDSLAVLGALFLLCQVG